MCVYICVCVHTPASVWVHVCLYKCRCMYVACTYVYMCIHVCACISILTCLNIIRVCICIHVCAYTCMCAQVHVCMLMEIRDQPQGLFLRSHPLIFETRSHQPLAGRLGYISRPAKPRDPPVSELVLPFQTCTTKPIFYVCAGIWPQVFMLAWLTETRHPHPHPLPETFFKAVSSGLAFWKIPTHHTIAAFPSGLGIHFNSVPPWGQREQPQAAVSVMIQN